MFLNTIQERETSCLPTDLDVINTLFESGDFQDWISLIRKSIEIRVRACQINQIESSKKGKKLVASFNENQTKLSKKAGLTLLTAQDTLQFINFQLQQTTLNIVKNIMDNL